VIARLDGNDVIVGLGGDDAICGGRGNDKLDGGTGNDNLIGNLGNDILLAGRGDDNLLGDQPAPGGPPDPSSWQPHQRKFACLGWVCPPGYSRGIGHPSTRSGDDDGC
jgi:hypothetical protein